MELIGKIYQIGETQTFGESFNKREFIIYVENERNIDWSDYIKLELTQDKCDLLNSFSIGDMVKCEFNLRGRLWTNKENKELCFNTIQAWRLDKVNSNNEHGQHASEPPQMPDDGNDLPF